MVSTHLKNISQNGKVPQFFRDENKTSLKPPPSLITISKRREMSESSTVSPAATMVPLFVHTHAQALLEISVGAGGEPVR